ncbi:MAG: hypothetical protein V1866_05255 [archaeon]
MGLSNNRKGVVLSLIALLMAVFFTIIFATDLNAPLDQKNDLVQSRVLIMNSFMESFFSYAEASASVSGYLSLRGMLIDQGQTHTYFDASLSPSNPLSLEYQFSYCMRTGNLTTTKLCPGMSTPAKNMTLTVFLQNLSAMAVDYFKMKANFTINNISITQSQPFTVDVIVNLTLKLSDEFANISDTRILTVPVTIEGLPDALYSINGTYNQTIKKTNITKLSGWNITDLRQLYSRHEYRNYPLAPSFLGRMEANFSATGIGIESFINNTAPSVIAYPYRINDSTVDHQFWRKISFNCSNVFNLSSTLLPHRFQLNDAYRVNFNITNNSLYSRSC